MKTYALDGLTTAFDYKNQAWVVNGRYATCGHRRDVSPLCTCYGRVHEGELHKDAVETSSSPEFDLSSIVTIEMEG